MNVIMQYGLYLKGSEETISTIPGISTESAKAYFMQIKQLSNSKFEKLFDVRRIK